VLEWIMDQIKNFVDKFWAAPSGGGGGFLSLEKIIRYESTHFLFSLFAGWLVFSLTLTILLSSRHREYDRYILSIGLLWGLFASVTMHMFIDGFTKLA